MKSVNQRQDVTKFLFTEADPYANPRQDIMSIDTVITVPLIKKQSLTKELEDSASVIEQTVKKKSDL